MIGGPTPKSSRSGSRRIDGSILIILIPVSPHRASAARPFSGRGVTELRELTRQLHFCHGAFSSPFTLTGSGHRNYEVLRDGLSTGVRRVQLPSSIPCLPSWYDAAFLGSLRPTCLHPELVTNLIYIHFPEYNSFGFFFLLLHPDTYRDFQPCVFSFLSCVIESTCEPSASSPSRLLSLLPQPRFTKASTTALFSPTTLPSLRESMNDSSTLPSS